MQWYVNRGGPHRQADGTRIPPGGRAKLPTRVAEAEPDRWEPVGNRSVPTEPEPATDLGASEESVEGEVGRDDPDVTDYHTGGGWYAVPGHDRKVRKSEALRLLAEGG